MNRSDPGGFHPSYLLRQLTIKRALQSVCGIGVVFYLSIGVTNGLGMCRQGGPLFPSEADLLEKAIPEMLSKGFPSSGMAAIERARGPQAELVSFTDAREYRTASPNCCGLGNGEHLPGSAVAGIAPPGLLDKIYGRGGHLVYAQVAAIDVSQLPVTPVASQGFILFWVDNCGSLVEIPNHMIVG